MSNEGGENVNLSGEKRRELTASLKEAIEKFKDSPRTSESEKEYWQDRWEAYGKLIDMKFDVPPCDRTEEEIKELEDKGLKLIYVPKELTTPEGIILLGKMYPRMGFLPYKSADIVNEVEASGWLDVEATHPCAKKKYY